MLAVMGSMPIPPSGSAWPSWSDAWPISKAGRDELNRIRGRLAAGAHAPEAFRAAVLRRLLREDRALLAGIAAYRRHPYERRLPDPPAIWTEGGTRLLDYGAPGATGPAVVFVPSLVNRAQVLELVAGSRLLRDRVDVPRMLDAARRDDSYLECGLLQRMFCLAGLEETMGLG